MYCLKKRGNISQPPIGLVAYRHTTEYGHRYTSNVEICTKVHTTFIHVFHITFCARFIIFFALFIFRFSLLCPMAVVLNKFVFLFVKCRYFGCGDKQKHFCQTEKNRTTSTCLDYNSSLNMHSSTHTPNTNENTLTTFSIWEETNTTSGGLRF